MAEPADHPSVEARAHDARPRPSRRALALLAAPLVGLVVVSYIGDALAPTLVDDHPAWLIAMNARNRNLALVTNGMNTWSYYGIGTVRLLVSDPLFFLLGYWYGDAAVEWMERRTHTWGQILRQIEKFFGRASYPLVFIAPNNYICLFAGAAGMSVRAFFALNISGTIVRLYVIRRFGEAFEGPLDDLVAWIGDHRWPLLIVSAGLVLVTLALEAKKGETEVTSLAHLDEELNEVDQELAHRRGAEGRGAGDEPGAPTDPAEPPDRPARGEAP